MTEAANSLRFRLRAEAAAKALNVAQGVSGARYRSGPADEKSPRLGALRTFQRGNLVAKGGIEPPTQGFSILCSTD